MKRPLVTPIFPKGQNSPCHELTQFTTIPMSSATQRRPEGLLPTDNNPHPNVATAFEPRLKAIRKDSKIGYGVGYGLPRDGYLTSGQGGQSSNSTPLEMNCINIAQHIDLCPICSRLYDTDKTLYILAIMGLLILCFLMVKRIVKL